MFKCKESPLYQGVTKSERRLIQEWNSEVIADGFSMYSLQPGEVEIFLNDLNINGKNTNEASLVIRHDRASTFARISYQDRPICRRTFHTGMRTTTDWAGDTIPFWMIDNSMLNTAVGYEGNGLGKALLLGTEGMIPPLIQTLDNSNRVVALHYDRAYGAEEDANCRFGYRTGWTSKMLNSLGYSNQKSTLEYYLGDKWVSQMGDADGNWIKIFRS